MKSQNRLWAAGTAAALIAAYFVNSQSVTQHASDEEIVALAGNVNLTNGKYQCKNGFLAAEWDMVDKASPSSFPVVATVTAQRSGEAIDAMVYIEDSYKWYFSEDRTPLYDSIVKLLAIRATVIAEKCALRESSNEGFDIKDILSGIRTITPHYRVNFAPTHININDGSVFTDYDWESSRDTCHPGNGYTASNMFFTSAKGGAVATATAKREGDDVVIAIYPNVKPQPPLMDELRVSAKALTINNITSCWTANVRFKPNHIIVKEPTP